MVMRFVSTCADGLEDLVCREVDDWGGRLSASGRGTVRWTGTLEAGYRCCLWSRFCSRLIMVLTECEVGGADDLHAVSKSVGWEEHLSEKNSFAVNCVITGKHSAAVIGNSMFGGLRVKDGIVDRFRDIAGQRPSVQTRRPDVPVYVQVDGRTALLGIDLSGESLHRRGYRVAAGPAPLKENLAAGIVRLSGWSGTTTLVDPMCGSATLLIEAALMHADSAPGLGRTYFGLFGWRGHQPHLWEALVAEALDRESAAQDRPWPRLVGFDADIDAVRAARKNIVQAGLEDRIVVEHLEMSRLKNRFGQAGHMVCNPPYGERLADKQTVRYLYRFMGCRFYQEFPDWNITVFTAAPDYADQFRLSSDTTRRMHNGPLACRLMSGLPRADPPRGDNLCRGLTSTISGGDGSELANRLRKNVKKLSPWAADRQLDCFRLYDRDLPQFNVSIDVFGSCFYITEFPPPGRDFRQADKRFSQIIRTVRDLFQVGRERVVIRRDRTTKGSGKGAIKQKPYEIAEGVSVLLAHLPGNPGTGYAVDQRFVRSLICELAGQGPFLSLFDATGAATVRACHGGAEKSITAGLSAAETAVAAKNFSRNGMAFENHRLVEQPVRAWLEQSRETFGLIYVNLSRRTYGRGTSWCFDTLRDHRDLLEAATARLAARGCIIVSSLVPSFRLDPELSTDFSCKDLSRALFPQDLPKTAKNFRCWRMTRKDASGRQ